MYRKTGPAATDWVKMTARSVLVGIKIHTVDDHRYIKNAQGKLTGTIYKVTPTDKYKMKLGHAEVWCVTD